ncbi:TolC family protein [Muriicola soli]|uniref:TolC family protein n=1 Tax=Muriicola soli TaxID=2507538 RepID=A0A411E9X7_9FLAO|nr:TolC family protein [Muriicola soli]QBA64535.1 TolC family protein [Muriicola soli]
MKQVIIVFFILFATGLKAQTLDDYFKIASENNPGLLAQHREFEAALQQVTQISSLPDPSLSVSAFGQMVETRVGPQQARFSLSQMFPWFGTLKAQGDAASLIAESKYQDYLNSKNRLYFELSKVYYPLYELRELSKLEERNVEILESFKTVSNSKFKNGNGTLVDILRVDIMLKEAKTKLGILRKKEKPLQESFNALLNRNEKDPVIIVDSLFLEPLSIDSLHDSINPVHPLIYAEELRVKAGEASEQAALKKGLPNLGIGLDYIMVGNRTDLPAGAVVPMDNGKDAIMPMVTVSLPIFRGKYKAAVKEAQLMQESYAYRKMEVINTLQAEYEQVLYEISEQSDLINLYAEQRNESEQILNLLLSSYGNSGKDFEEVLRMQQQILNFDKSKVSALTQYTIAKAKLEYITAKRF